jgi:two-component system OmpR family response regulator
VRFALERAGHTIREAEDGRVALSVLGRSPIDLIVLDILMPEIDGLEVCRELRRSSEIPVLFLSSRDDEVDRVVGLELGADDYVVKPFSPRELVARIKGILRRTHRPGAEERAEADSIQHGRLALDGPRHRCSWNGEIVPLTVTEFGLLQSLCGMPGKVYTRDELVERAYGAGHHITDRTVDSHVRRIREKFRCQGGEPVETVYGLGYRLSESACA